MEWEAYDPSWLVELAKSQLPQESWLAESLAACKMCCWESAAYVHFVDPSRANEPGSAWQFKENITLEEPDEGDLVLDVLKDGRVGGVEFISRI